LLYLFAKPDCSSSEVDGFAAWRQGIQLLNRHVGTGASAGTERSLGLEKAAVNLHFAHAVAEDTAERCRLYLFEAVSRALLGWSEPGNEEQLGQALHLLRMIEDEADSSAHMELKLVSLQALYNRAVIEQRRGDVRSTDTARTLYHLVLQDSGRGNATSHSEQQALDALTFLARFGYVMSADACSSDEWQYLDEPTARQWCTEAVVLVNAVDRAGWKGSTRNSQLADLIQRQAHRAAASLLLRFIDVFGDVSLPRVGTSGSSVPVPFLSEALTSLEFLRLKQLPDAAFYRNLTFALLLRRDAAGAREVARRGIHAGETDELLYYAAAWAAYEAGDKPEAQAICQRFPKKALEEFIALEATVSAEIRTGLERKRRVLIGSQHGATARLTGN
jgi:hypothetical protein